MKRCVVVSVCLAVASMPSRGVAAPSAAFTYQGQLLQAGVPIDGTADMKFRLYDVAAGGAALGEQVIDDVPVAEGLFTVVLNGAAEFGSNAFDGGARWLEVEVNGQTLAPRQALTAAPYAAFACAPWVKSGADISYTGGNVGVGVAPQHPLHTTGNARLDGRLAVGNDGNFGPFSGIDWFFDLSQIATDFAGATTWTLLSSYLTANPAVDLPNHALHSHDLILLIPEGNDSDYYYAQGPYGGAFHYGSGIVEYLPGGNFGAENMRDGTVLDLTGGYFFALGGPGCTGSIGTATAVYAFSGHDGVGGQIDANYAFYAATPYHDRPLMNHYGLYLEDQDFGVNDSYAIYAAGGNSYLNGDLDVTGTLSKGAGSFKIDHPLDPENKFLLHSFVESPDMMNVYNGNVVLDAQGEAVIELPEWFESLNGDYRYQLTCIGGFAPVYVAEEVKDNRFRIGGGQGGLKVSWQVTGVRRDAYANAHRIPVEQDKPANLRGTYLHPEEHGATADRGMEAARQRTRKAPSAAQVQRQRQHAPRGR
jgi:hypothetical protein